MRVWAWWWVLQVLVVVVATGRAVQVHRECQREGNIAFTFDQGPSQYTGILLTSLAKAGVKATFHVVPDYLDNPVLSANLRRAAAEGHLIGLFVRDSITEATIKEYLGNATSVIKQYVNYQPEFLRFPLPGPSEAILKIITPLGYKVTNYNLDSLDYNHVSDVTEPNGEGQVFRNIQDILEQIVPPTLGSFICVQRDIAKPSVMQMPAILNYVKGRGYKAVKLDACVGVGMGLRVDHRPDDSSTGSSGGPLQAASTSAASPARRTGATAGVQILLALLVLLL